MLTADSVRQRMSTEDARRSDATPAASRRSSWSKQPRFVYETGWTHERTRDEERFAALAARLEDPQGGDADVAMSNRFRPCAELEVARAVGGVVDPASCTAEGSGLVSTVVRVPGRFTIVPRTAAGQAVAPHPTDVFHIEFLGIEKPQYSIVEDVHTGHLLVRWLPTVASDFAIGIRCRGVHIAGSPFTVRGIVGEIDPSKSIVVGLPKSVKVGGHVNFEIEVRDQLGFLASYPPLNANKAGYTFKVAVMGPTPVTAHVDPLVNGVQTGGFRLKKVGEYKVTVRGQDDTVVLDPLTGRDHHLVAVCSTSLEAKYCTAVGDGLCHAVAGELNTFEIVGVDEHSNPCDVGHFAHRPDCGFDVRLTLVRPYAYSDVLPWRHPAVLMNPRPPPRPVR